MTMQTTTKSRILLGLTALMAATALAGCAHSGDTSNPADIKTAIKGTPLPPDQMAKVEAAAAAQGQAAQDKAKAKQSAALAQHGAPPAGSH